MAGLEVQAKFLHIKKNVHFDSARDIANETDKIDLVERFGLKEAHMEKLAWGSYIKTYLKGLKDSLEKDGKKSRISTFKIGATALAKHITKMYDKVKLY